MDLIHGGTDSAYVGMYGVHGPLCGLTRKDVACLANLAASVQVSSMLVRSIDGLKAGQSPEAVLEGMGGTYFLTDDKGEKSAIFKPCDEEPLAPNNPKQWQGRAMGAPGMKPGIRVGEAALREVAAYLLDHDGFAGVAPACLVKCYHPILNYKVCNVEGPSPPALHLIVTNCPLNQGCLELYFSCTCSYSNQLGRAVTSGLWSFSSRCPVACVWAVLSRTTCQVTLLVCALIHVCNSPAPALSALASNMCY
jgi:hypothetical protein